MSAPPIIVRHLGSQLYRPVWQQMQAFTATRTDSTPDELWFVEHPAVFTQGQAGKAEHILNPGDIPIVQTDRGGQVTFHGPGQMVVYPLLNLKRLGLGVREFVSVLEQSVIETLEFWGIAATARKQAPGVYVGERKIASLGLRVRRGCCYHGLSLNVTMNLEPFSRINPCGYNDLEVTDLQALADCRVTVDDVKPRWLSQFFRLSGLRPLDYSS